MPTTPIIDTDGVTVRDIPDAELPVYSIAKAVQWVQAPENAPRIEAFAKQAGKVQDDMVRKIDDTVTKVSRQLVKLMTDDDELDSFKNALLGSLIGDE